MTTLTARLGLGAALTSLVSFVVYTISFLAILGDGEPFVWTNLQDYVSREAQGDPFFKYLAMAFMVAYGLCYVVEMACLEEATDQSRQILARLAVLFGLGFAILVGINYFVQLTAVRLQLQAGQTDGLQQWIMSYPISGVAAVNMLGWTVFLGLSSLCITFCFGRSRPARFCAYAFLANALFMLAAVVGFVADLTLVVFICMYVGLGATMLATAVGLCWLFGSQAARPTAAML